MLARIANLNIWSLFCYFRPLDGIDARNQDCLIKQLLNEVKVVMDGN